MIEDWFAQNKLSATDALLEQKLKTHYIDLASERLGGETLSCSDDFFAKMENLLKPGRGVFIAEKFTEHGKWMDGWESRRSYGRNNGRDSDWCIIRLGIRGVIRAFDIDTNYFRGNAPEKVSVEACVSEMQPDKDTVWHTVFEATDIEAHSQNLFEIANDTVWTHVRLRMFPDGGIARFRVYGEAYVNWDDFVDGELINLASISNGAKALLASDMFFSNKNNLIMPGRGVNMGDGWQTKRSRNPDPDWSIIKLAATGSVNKVIIDTCHFKGNFPDSFMLEGCISDNDDFTDDTVNRTWTTIIQNTKLHAHREHVFTKEIITEKNQPFTHVRLNIYPDGGISRMRVLGNRQG
ncbi:allantoicase [Colwellia ponticola]|uniref:Probable allantoicase n=1 Tax=Colwellia ponticola TaxID=2304625 RepID=A0A8H2JLW2_9GAMM|nr:allantoicase [Colwellia ponticola]TMM45412.1 allantoicase [Colwellia ponticola]